MFHFMLCSILFDRNRDCWPVALSGESGDVLFVALLHRNITIIAFFQAVAVSSHALSVSMPTWSLSTAFQYLGLLLANA